MSSDDNSVFELAFDGKNLKVEESSNYGNHPSADFVTFHDHIPQTIKHPQWSERYEGF